MGNNCHIPDLVKAFSYVENGEIINCGFFNDSIKNMIDAFDNREKYDVPFLEWDLYEYYINSRHKVAYLFIIWRVLLKCVWRFPLFDCFHKTYVQILQNLERLEVNHEYVQFLKDPFCHLVVYGYFFVVRLFDQLRLTHISLNSFALIINQYMILTESLWP